GASKGPLTTSKSCGRHPSRPARVICFAKLHVYSTRGHLRMTERVCRVVFNACSPNEQWVDRMVRTADGWTAGDRMGDWAQIFRWPYQVLADRYHGDCRPLQLRLSRNLSEVGAVRNRLCGVD